MEFRLVAAFDTRRAVRTLVHAQVSKASTPHPVRSGPGVPGTARHAIAATDQVAGDDDPSPFAELNLHAFAEAIGTARSGRA